jgi:hypothetical protein
MIVIKAQMFPQLATSNAQNGIDFATFSHGKRSYNE